jgi:hypothetical protein
MSAREPWYIEPHTATYRVVSAANHAGERLAMLAAIGALQFEALSIGTRRGQIAIVPLDESTRENAAFIVRACNTHDELLAAAQDLVKLLEDVGEKTEWRDGVQTDRVFAWFEFDALRAAIAKAKGGAK